MTQISKEQEEFLEKNQISISDVFDATGLRKKDYRQAMKKLGKNFAIGVTPCKKKQHTLRTRAGHCAQCNAARIAFQKRHSETLYVYVAGSNKLRAIKVGVCNEPSIRQQSLRELDYGGSNDWNIVFYVKVKNAGLIEFMAHKTLNIFAKPTKHIKEGKEVHCLETFSCSAKIAIESIEKETNEIIEEWTDHEKIDEYDFEEIQGESFKRYKKEKSEKNLSLSEKKLTTDVYSSINEWNKKTKMDDDDYFSYLGENIDEIKKETPKDDKIENSNSKFKKNIKIKEKERKPKLVKASYYMRYFYWGLGILLLIWTTRTEGRFEFWMIIAATLIPFFLYIFFNNYFEGIKVISPSEFLNKINKELNSNEPNKE